MAATIKPKVQQALQTLIVEPSAGDKLELEDVPPNKVAGTLISSKFEGLTHAQRQDLIWDELDAALDTYERTRVVIILAHTPEEYEARKESA
jgi:acid stress-induced BolA-like protein IbaG/YrbA